MSPLANITQIVVPPTDFANEYHAIKSPTIRLETVGVYMYLIMERPDLSLIQLQLSGVLRQQEQTELIRVLIWCSSDVCGIMQPTELILVSLIIFIFPMHVQLIRNLSVQATPLAVTAISANAMTLNWTRGNGSECIVIMHQAGAVTNTPTDGSAYIASSTFDQVPTLLPMNTSCTWVVGNTCTVTGLNPNTSHSFSVFEFNGTGCTTNFLVTSPATGSATTIGCVLASEPTVQSSNLLLQQCCLIRFSLTGLVAMVHFV